MNVGAKAADSCEIHPRRALRLPGSAAGSGRRERQIVAIRPIRKAGNPLGEPFLFSYVMKRKAICTKSFGD